MAIPIATKTREKIIYIVFLTVFHRGKRGDNPTKPTP
jgi:hypothetical protein